MLHKPTIIITMLVLSCGQPFSNGQAYMHSKYFSKSKILYSPDGKIKAELGVRGNDSTNWTTQVIVYFNGCGGGAYAVEGKDLNIDIRWKDNNTLIIYTKKYKAYQKFEQIGCFFDQIKVVYFENN